MRITVASWVAGWDVEKVVERAVVKGAWSVVLMVSPLEALLEVMMAGEKAYKMAQ